MIGSNSIGRLSRASGDEQLLKSQRVADKKGKQDADKRQKDKPRDDDKSKREFESVIVDVVLNSEAKETGQKAGAHEPARIEEADNSHATKEQLLQKSLSSVKQDQREAGIPEAKIPEAETPEAKTPEAETPEAGIKGQIAGQSVDHIDVTG